MHTTEITLTVENASGVAGAILREATARNTATTTTAAATTTATASTVDVSTAILCEASRRRISREQMADRLDMPEPRLAALLAYDGGAGLYVSEVEEIASLFGLRLSEFVRRMGIE